MCWQGTVSTAVQSGHSRATPRRPCLHRFKASCHCSGHCCARFALAAPGAAPTRPSAERLGNTATRVSSANPPFHSFTSILIEPLPPSPVSLPPPHRAFFQRFAWIGSRCLLTRYDEDTVARLLPHVDPALAHESEARVLLPQDVMLEARPAYSLHFLGLHMHRLTGV